MNRGGPSTPSGRVDRRATAAGGAARSADAGRSGEATGDAWRIPNPDEAADFDSSELRDFLAADLLDVQADPVFKERLRQKLWRLVRLRYGDGADED